MGDLIEGWFDGACEPKNPGGHGSYGAIVKVNKKIVWSESGYVGYGNGISNNVAEFIAFTAALNEARKYPGIIKMYGDSKLVVMLVTGQWNANGGIYFPYYLKAVELYNEEKNRTMVEWIPREKNQEADDLSKAVLVEKGITITVRKK